MKEVQIKCKSGFADLTVSWFSQFTYHTPAQEGWQENSWHPEVLDIQE